MLSFPPQNDTKNFSSDLPGVLEKTDPDDSKPTFFKSGLMVIISFYF